MRRPRPAEVPFSAAISGLVFLACFLNLATPLHIVYLLAGYAVLGLVEWWLRSRRVSGTPHAARPRAARLPDPRPDATTGAGT
jgi:hypothetical protein